MNVPEIGMELTVLFEAEVAHEESIRCLRENRRALDRTAASIDVLRHMRPLTVQVSEAIELDRSMEQLLANWIRLRLARSRQLQLFNKTYDELEMIRKYVDQQSSLKTGED